MSEAADLVARAEAVAREGEDALSRAASLDDIADVERRYLGKSSALNEIREAIKSVDGSERAVVGKALSGARAELEAAYAARLEVLDAQAATLSATRDRLDVTLGPHEYVRGHLHPVTKVNHRACRSCLHGQSCRFTGGFPWQGHLFCSLSCCH